MITTSVVLFYALWSNSCLNNAVFFRLPGPDFSFMTRKLSEFVDNNCAWSSRILQSVEGRDRSFRLRHQQDDVGLYSQRELYDSHYASYMNETL